MGSLTRMNRCERFCRVIGPELVKTSTLKVGRLYEVKGVNVAESEDGNEVVKMYYTLEDRGVVGDVMNQFPGDEHTLTTDETLFDPEETPQSEVIERVATWLVNSKAGETLVDEAVEKKRTKQAVRLLKKAELID